MKKERYDRAEQMEMDGRGENPEMSMVQGSHRSSFAGGRSLDGGNAGTLSIDAPYTDDPCPATTYRQVQSQKNVRRPFLHSNSSFGILSGSNTPSRSKSLHETDGQAISEYLRSRNYDTVYHNGSDSRYDTPHVVISSATDADVQPSDASGSARSASYLDITQAMQDGQKTRPRSDTNASATSKASESLLQQYDDIVRAGEVVRGTASMDLWRPSHMSLHHHAGREEAIARARSPPRSGREIAQDADTYAALHGALRPDLGRMRGESSAALLGRPELDV
jgi:hypothetical protein